MSSPQAMDGLSLDQAPPLVIPLSFFCTAPVFLILAAVLLLLNGSAVLSQPLAPSTVGFAHLGTLGFLTMVMMGALYQMTPVVAVAAVPGIRAAHLVHFMMTAGGLGLGVWSLGVLPPTAALHSFWQLGAAVLVFAIPVGVALMRSKAGTPTVAGMRLAVASLLVVMALGVWMSQGWGGGTFSDDRGYLIQVHLTVALLGWVGGLITAVGWQVLPMFYMTPEFSGRQSWGVFALSATGIAGVLTVGLFTSMGYLESAGSTLAALAALPLAFAVWIWHPLMVLAALRNRRRKRVDASVDFWRASMILGPVVAVSALLALTVNDTTFGPRLDLLFGWLSILGWAGLVIHGMLTRIGPFLIWFHRFSPYVGKMPVPAMKRMIPAKWIQLGLGLHLATLALGSAGILTNSDWLLRLTGAALLATGLTLAAYFKVLVRLKPDLSQLPKS